MAGLPVAFSCFFFPSSSSIGFDVDFSLINNEMKAFTIAHRKSGNEGKRQVNIISLVSVNRIKNDIGKTFPFDSLIDF